MFGVFIERRLPPSPTPLQNRALPIICEREWLGDKICTTKQKVALTQRTSKHRESLERENPILLSSSPPRLAQNYDPRPRPLANLRTRPVWHGQKYGLSAGGLPLFISSSRGPPPVSARAMQDYLIRSEQSAHLSPGARCLLAHEEMRILCARVCVRVLLRANERMASKA